jgi:hypothetical protein
VYGIAAPLRELRHGPLGEVGARPRQIVGLLIDQMAGPVAGGLLAGTLLYPAPYPHRPRVFRARAFPLRPAGLACGAYPSAATAAPPPLPLRGRGRASVAGPAGTTACKRRRRPWSSHGVPGMIGFLGRAAGEHGIAGAREMRDRALLWLRTQVVGREDGCRRPGKRGRLLA